MKDGFGFETKVRMVRWALTNALREYMVRLANTPTGGAPGTVLPVPMPRSEIARVVR